VFIVNPTQYVALILRLNSDFQVEIFVESLKIMLRILLSCGNETPTQYSMTRQNC